VLGIEYGGHSDRVTPDPFPNSVDKPVRVLHCTQMRELSGNADRCHIHLTYSMEIIASFAPSSIALAYRNGGVGSELIKASFKLAKEMGYNSVFLVGDPALYHRFGFKAAINFGI
jgi:GNAT superfamily N-acetyltransferase